MSCFGATKKKAALDESRVVRPLGHLERYVSVFQDLGQYCSCIVTGRYAVPSEYHGEPEGQALRDVFERAVALVVIEHPLLQVGQAGNETKHPSWCRLDRIDFRHHITWHTAKGAQQSEALILETSQTEHDTRFTHLETRPGWKINAIHCPAEDRIEIIFAFNHTVGDGTSGKIFHQTLLEKLNLPPSTNAAVQLKGRVLELPPIANFPPAYEQLLKLSFTPGFVLSEIFRIFRPKQFAPAIRSCDSWGPIRPGPLNTQMRVVRIGHETLQACLGACRQNGTTLTGLIHALGLASLVMRTPADEKGAIVSGTPISMRRFAGRAGPDAERTFVNCVTNCNHRFGPAELDRLRKPAPAGKGGAGEVEGAVWAIAAHVREDLVRKLCQGTKNDVTGLLKFVGDPRAYLVGTARKPRSTSLECSNLGVLDGGAAAEGEASDTRALWTIDQALFSQSACLTGPAVTMNPIAVQGRDLCITFCWQGGVVDDAVIKGLAADVEAWLNHLGQEGHLRFDS